MGPSSGRPGLLLFAGRGQRLIVCPFLDAALELFLRCRCSASWMPNDPYDLASTPAPTGGCRRPMTGGQALAVSAAAVTDHVCDRWHGWAASQASVTPAERAHSRLGASAHVFAALPREWIDGTGRGGRSSVSLRDPEDRRVTRCKENPNFRRPLPPCVGGVALWTPTCMEPGVRSEQSGLALPGERSSGFVGSVRVFARRSYHAKGGARVGGAIRPG